MKRALSLILAVVMVALMIPFAAIIASATEEETPSGSPLVFDLPEGWVMSKDDGVGTANKVDANGVTLGSDTQSIAMTEKVGVGQKRVVTVDYGIVGQAGMLHLTWEAEQPSAGNVPQNDNGKAFGGNDLYLCLYAGPDLGDHVDGSIANLKASISESDGGWLDSVNQNITGYVRATKDGDWSVFSGKRWAINNNHNLPDDLGKWGEVDAVLVDGACGTNGTKMVLYVEIDENNYITGAYTQFVKYDAEGNFVKEYVVYTENTNTYKAACDGYLTIGHTTATNKVDASKAAVAIKSVSINAGTAKEMGEVLHSTDFQAYGAENVQKVEMPSSPVATLPEGWVISTDDGVGTANKVDANGVTLGSDTQSIAMTEKVGVGQKRVVTVDYGIVGQAGMLHLTWEAEQPSAGNVPQNDNGKAFGGNDLYLCLYAGPDLGDHVDGSIANLKASISESDGGWLDSVNQNITGYVRATKDGDWSVFSGKRWAINNNHNLPDDLGKWGEVDAVLVDGACGTNGTKMVLYVEIDENNYITGAYTQFVKYDAEGNFVKEYVVYTENTNTYKAACDGYLTIGHTTATNKVDASKAAVAIKSVSINAGTAKEMGETLHSTDFQAYGAENVQNAADYFVYMNNVADTTTIATGEASLRVIEEENGIRFTSKFDAADLQLLVNLYEAGAVSKIEVGTLVTTKDWAEAAGAVTHAALDAKAGDKTAYVEVMATVGDWYADNTFAGTISNVSAEREYQAAGFIRMTLANDEVVFVYSAVNAATLASVTPVEA